MNLAMVRKATQRTQAEAARKLGVGYDWAASSSVKSAIRSDILRIFVAVSSPGN
jgi:hypothetical protein